MQFKLVALFGVFHKNLTYWLMPTVKPVFIIFVVMSAVTTLIDKVDSATRLVLNQPLLINSAYLIPHVTCTLTIGMIHLAWRENYFPAQSTVRNTLVFILSIYNFIRKALLSSPENSIHRFSPFFSMFLNS